MSQKISIYPDYYPDFQCKGSQCRFTCCQGWGVSISRDQYYRLQNIDCEPSLKQLIERTFIPKIHPSPESFAEVFHTYQGTCPLLNSQGYCALHSGCGEQSLPDVCRMYPRSVQPG